MGFVKHGFILAFYCLLRTKDFPVNEIYDFAIEQTIMLAGDADTNAAIVGGLIGAFVGVSNMPQNKVKKVLECNHSKGNTKSRPDFVKPQIDGFTCIMTLLSLAPKTLEIVKETKAR